MSVELFHVLSLAPESRSISTVVSTVVSTVIARDLNDFVQDYMYGTVPSTGMELNVVKGKMEGRAVASVARLKIYGGGDLCPPCLTLAMYSSANHCIVL